MRPLPYFMYVNELAIIARVHRRNRYLEDIFDQICELGRGRRVHIVYQYDRPSQEVVHTLDWIQENAPEWVRITLTEGPKILSNDGQRWQKSLQHGFSLCAGADAAILWDDDWLFTDEALLGMRAHLEDFQFDRLDAEWYHLWDEEDQYNALFPAHWACCLFRVYPQDEFKKLISHCPDFAARSTNAKRVHFRVRHYGYFTQEDRDAAWQAAKASGRLDAHTLCLVKEPVLEKINGA